MRINPDIHRQQQRFIRQVTVRVAIELPSAAARMQPDAHRVMAKNDPLLAHMDFGQGTPGSKDTLRFARHFVVVSFDKMDRFAVQALAIGRHLFNAAHAKIPKEIERIVWLDVRVHPFRDARIHLFRVLKRTIEIGRAHV